MKLPKENFRCLIIGCSQKKNKELPLLPALQRYNGPSYKVLHKYLAERSNSNLDIYILSAKFGLIPHTQEIPNYDQRMTYQRATKLKTDVSNKFQQLLHNNYQEIFFSMGKIYLQAIDLSVVPEIIQTKLIISRSSSGKKLTELKSWLWKIEENVAKNNTDKQLVTPNNLPQTATLRGNTVSLTTQQATLQIISALTPNESDAYKIRNWYVQVQENQLSPKWAAMQLFNVPVRNFAADEARRVLYRLGLNCYKL